MKKPFDLVIQEHNGEDSLSINFEDKKAVLSWEDEAGSRTCDKVIWAIDRVFAAYDGKRPSVESAQEEINMINYYSTFLLTMQHFFELLFYMYFSLHFY